jgi:hypothetical protein
VEAVFVFFLSSRWLPAQKPKFLSRLGMAAVGGLVVLYSASLLQDLALKIAFLVVALLAFGIAAWFWGLAPAERNYLIQDRMRAPVRAEPN